MDNDFCVKYCRLHIEDKNKVFFGGFWKQRRRKDTDIIASLDYSILEMMPQEERQTKMSFGELEQEMIKENMSWWILLPEDYKNYKKLRIFERDGTKLREIFSISVSKLIEKGAYLPMHIDAVSYGREGTSVRGWLIAKDYFEIKITNKKGQNIPAIHNVQKRPDVEKAYPESEKGWIHGYILSVPEKVEGKIDITINCDGKEETSRYKVGRFRFSKNGRDFRVVIEKIKIWGNKIRVYYQQFGLKLTIKRAVEKITHKEKRDYETYCLKYMPSKKQLEKQRQEKFAYMPVFGIVVPVYRTRHSYLEEMIQSVRNQSYSKWKLYLSDGSGKNSKLRKILEDYEKADERISVIHNEEKLGIAENTNRALALVEEEFIAFLDHDDILCPDALYECVKALNNFPETEIIYTDEDKVSIDGKEYYEPNFKPDFNIDYLRSINYINHLTVVKKTLLNQVGTMNPQYNGAQDHDFVLRCIEKSDKIYHIPKVLYHWRIHPESVNGEEWSKDTAYAAGREALLAHYKRVGIDAGVEVFYPGIYRTIYHLPSEPLVSIIIANKDQKKVLQKCIESLENDSLYRNIEILIVENNSESEEIFTYYKELEETYNNIRILTYEKEFNYADIQNFAVDKARSEYLLLLNNDTWLDNLDSIREMLGYCMRPDVGIVGAKLLYPDNTIQHGGVIVGLGGVAGHAFLGDRRNSSGYFCRAVCAQEYSAVTAACIMVKKSVYKEVGGMDPGLKVAFNDVDFCLRVGEKGYRVVYQPYAIWYHDESKTRGKEDTEEKILRFKREIEYFQKRWKIFLQNGDPYYNRNLALDRHDFSLKE